MDKRAYSRAFWHTHPLNPKGMTDEQVVDWIFVVDLLNFSFWSDEPYRIEYGGRKYTGYWSLCAVIDRALAQGIDITDPKYYGNASDSELISIFSVDEGTMPMVSERVRLLRESGQILLAKFKGTATNLLKQAARDPFKLIELLCCNFHSFLDISTYNGKPVFFLKRAQIFIADLWACFDGKGYGDFDQNKIDAITMFADYRLPQILQALGVLHLDSDLLTRMCAGELLNVHENSVIELRGCSIHAVRLLCEAMRNIQRSGPTLAMINAIMIDFFLWDLIQERPDLVKNIHIHRTRSLFY